MPFHMLVVDDEEALELLFNAFFDKDINEGKITISFTPSAQKCLDFIEEVGRVDLVLTDINMPGMNGYALLEKLKVSYADMPVYIISAYGTEDYIQKAKELGADEFFVKPFDFSLIKEKISQLYS